MKFLDDWSWVIDQAARVLVAKGVDPDKALQEHISMSCRKCLHLLFAGNCEFGGSQVELFSVLKKQIFVYMKHRCDEALQNHMAEMASQAQLVIAKTDSAPVKFLELRSFVSELQSCDNANLFFLPCYRKICEHAKHRLSTMDLAQSSLRDILSVVLEETDKVYKPEWVSVMVKCLDSECAEQDAPADIGEEEQEEEEDNGDNERDIEDRASISKAPKEESMAVLFPAQAAEAADGSGVNTTKLLQCLQVRCKFVFQALQDMLWSTPYASRRALHECGEKFTVFLQSEEVEHTTMSSRLEFWTAVWSSLPSAITTDELEKAIFAASAIAKGETVPQPAELAPAAANTGDTGNIGNTGNQQLQLTPVGTDAAELKMFRQLADIPRALTKVEQVRIVLELKHRCALAFSQVAAQSQNSACISFCKSQLFVGQDSQDYILPFFGDVVIAPSNSITTQKLKIGKLYGCTLWLVPSNDHTCLAWHADITNESSEATAILVSTKVTITVADGKNIVVESFHLKPTDGVSVGGKPLCRLASPHDPKNFRKMIEKSQSALKRSLLSANLIRSEAHTEAAAKKAKIPSHLKHILG